MQWALRSQVTALHFPYTLHICLWTECINELSFEPFTAQAQQTHIMSKERACVMSGKCGWCRNLAVILQLNTPWELSCFFPATDQVWERLTEDTNYVLKIQYNQMKLFTVTAHVIMSACFSQHIRCYYFCSLSHFLQLWTETKCSSRPFKIIHAWYLCKAICNNDENDQTRFF